MRDSGFTCRRLAVTALLFSLMLAPDGGRLSKTARQDVKNAVSYGLNVDCGLHDYL